MTYIIIKLTNGEWVKILSKDIVAICTAQTNDKDELFIERHLYSGNEDNTVLNSEQELWRDIQVREREP